MADKPGMRAAKPAAVRIADDALDSAFGGVSHFPRIGQEAEVAHGARAGGGDSVWLDLNAGTGPRTKP